MLSLSFYRRLELNKLTPTEISLQMVDKSTAIPIGICEDVPVVIANVAILTDLLFLIFSRTMVCLLFLEDPF